MKRIGNNERGNTHPGTALSILVIIGMVAYLLFDAMNGDPTNLSLSTVFKTWLGWSWWAKGLSIGAPIGLVLIGNMIDSGQGFSKS